MIINSEKYQYFTNSFLLKPNFSIFLVFFYEKMENPIDIPKKR